MNRYRPQAEKQPFEHKKYWGNGFQLDMMLAHD